MRELQGKCEAGAVRRADEGADDALKVDLHRALAEPIGQSARSLDDEPLVHGADAVAIEDGQAEAFGGAFRNFNSL